MPEWLQHTFESDMDVSITDLATRQIVALIFGVVVGVIYRLAQRSGSSAMGGPRQRAEMHATLVMLTVLISMMTGVIGDNIARAFAIVGALSIVRFRTVIEDTRDTAFVILAVAVGMAAGAGYVMLPLVTLPIVAIAAVGFTPRNVDGNPVAKTTCCRLMVRVGTGAAGETAVRQAIAPLVESMTIESIESARQGAALETTFLIELRQPEDAHTVVSLASRIEGVHNVELKRV